LPPFRGILKRFLIVVKGTLRKSRGGSEIALQSLLNVNLILETGEERELYVCLTLELHVVANFGIMSIASMNLSLFLPAHENKFIFGDLTESHVLGLVKASGHTLEGLQTPVDVFGIRGHRDCVINGMLFDVKSCSSRAFDKFKYNKLREDDAFGYISQLSSYLYGSRNDPLVTEKNKAGFLAVDKQFGHIAVDIYDLTEDLERKEEEVLRKQHVVNEVEPPERAYEPVPHNKSGNMKLPTACSYCEYSRICWPEARKFLYSNGPVFLTKVEREPTGNVFEDKDW
jgi:CRISPR/Cas system-associated exonuclease Cas4 (RecB family)